MAVVRTPYLCCALLGALTLAASAAAQGGAPRPARLVPSIPKQPPQIDGELETLKNAVQLTPAAPGGEGAAAWTAKVAYHKDTLYLGVEAADQRVLNGDVLEISLFFPGGGTTARGHTWRFGPTGLRAPEPGALPAYAQKMVEAKVQPREGGLNLEMAIPARALPRFPAKDPLVFDLCIRFEDRDEPAAAPTVSSNCRTGTMQDKALRLPDDFRRALKIKPPDGVTGLEGRPEGWVGYAVLHYPVWVSADAPLNAPLLRRLVTDEEVDAQKAGINLPDALLLPDGNTVLSVLSGEDPYGVQGSCDTDKELRIAFYLVKKKAKAAERVLEWPASTCALGRAAAIELEDGELTMGYTNGSTVNFVWSGDRFERTEIGSR